MGIHKATNEEHMKIVIEIKSVYGNEMIYPINEEAKTFAAIAGKKTLSRSDIAKIKSLGFEVSVLTKEF